jgi:hypothetical protein
MKKDERKKHSLGHRASPRHPARYLQLLPRLTAPSDPAVVTSLTDSALGPVAG